VDYALAAGGKRVRPILAYRAARALGKPDAPALTHAAIALELVHTYSLIHDDLPAMDNDDLRRGKPTCHIAFDEATAILGGDALQALAFEQLARIENPNPQTFPKLVLELAHAAGPSKMVLGQAMDMSATARTVDLAFLQDMHNKKTGALISASVVMGALSTGPCPDEVLDRLRTYGIAIGLAFQIKDDLLDALGNSETLGKRAGADQAADKSTYTTLLGIDGAQQKLRQLHLDAMNALSGLGPNAEYLGQIADLIVHRKH
jgi:geranylgeranyl pyrophosphate synthase